MHSPFAPGVTIILDGSHLVHVKVFHVPGGQAEVKKIVHDKNRLGYATLGKLTLGHGFDASQERIIDQGLSGERLALLGLN